MLIDPAAVAAAERIRAQTGARVHRLGHPDELQEDAMPKKASTEPKADPAPAPKKRGRKPRDPNAAPAARKSKVPRFGVFDDGSVMIELPNCAGQMNPDEVAEFTGFLKRIGVKL